MKSLAVLNSRQMLLGRQSKEECDVLVMQQEQQDS
jgi:hypothetical protein